MCFQNPLPHFFIMKQSLFYRDAVKPTGYTEIAGQDHGALTWLKFGVLRLDAGQSWYNRERHHETFLLILSGVCDVQLKHQTFTGVGKRKRVFSGKPYGCFIGMDKAYKVVAHTPLEVAVCMAKTKKKGDAFLVRPGQVKKRVSGRGIAKHTLHDVLQATHTAHRLIVGETLLKPGKWTHASPHRHERDMREAESQHECVCFFKTMAPIGGGLQYILTEDSSQSQAAVIGNDTVSVIGEGYHATCAWPTHALHYIWVMAGNRRQVTERFHPHF